ncbi:transposase [Pueribacillus sp. YX66]|uniref:transposase n=1 Tax=Pueribacillus sp. YX66 TaxID=3229242 RepID=UPI00358D4DF8
MNKIIKYTNVKTCSDCPLKAKCTIERQCLKKMKAKVRKALECKENVKIYALLKIEVESVFGHIKANRSFRRFSLRGLDKVHVEFGIVAMTHNLLKVAGIRQLFLGDAPKNTKSGGGKRKTISLHLIYFRDFLDSPFFLSKKVEPYFRKNYMKSKLAMLSDEFYVSKQE